MGYSIWKMLATQYTVEYWLFTLATAWLAELTATAQHHWPGKRPKIQNLKCGCY